jgi:hypothetical protein
MWLPTWITTNPSRVAKRERERKREKDSRYYYRRNKQYREKKAVST